MQLTEEVRGQLKKPTFDNWQWDESEMLILLRQMFLDLGLVHKFNIQVGVGVDVSGGMGMYRWGFRFGYGC